MREVTSISSPGATTPTLPLAPPSLYRAVYHFSSHLIATNCFPIYFLSFFLNPRDAEGEIYFAEALFLIDFLGEGVVLSEVKMKISEGAMGLVG